MRNQYYRIKDSFPSGTKIAYAVKANYVSSVIRTFDDLESHFDVFSPGELRLLKMNNCDLKRVVYTSVAETKREFKYALENGVRRFVLGSIKGIRCFNEALESSRAENPNLLLRIQPLSEVEAFVSTSGQKSKFGTVPSGKGDSVEHAMRELENLDLDLAGFHFHLGSQVEGPEYYESAIHKTLEIADSFDIEIEVLDIGGGYPVEYTPDVEPIETYGEGISKAVKQCREKFGDFELVLEPGRFLVGDSTIFVSSVVNVKEMYGRRVVILDGSSDMVTIDRHEVPLNLGIFPEREGSVKTAIAGNFCHSADWISEKPREVPEVKLGDLFLFYKSGSYVMNHNIPYNMRKIPNVVSVDGDRLKSEDHPFQLIQKVGGAYSTD